MQRIFNDERRRNGLILSNPKLSAALATRGMRLSQGARTCLTRRRVAKLNMS